jgi:signal transduction histidine kinase
MNIYYRNTVWKLLLFLFAVIIGLFTLLYTQSLVRKLKNEEKKKVELWAEATKQIINSPENNQNISFFYYIIENIKTIPLILTDEADSIISVRNLDSLKISNRSFIQKELTRMKAHTDPIIIDTGGGHINKIYYRESTLLRKLTWFPFVQLSVILLFILVSYLAFSSSRKAEQNQVWVGMSKETAHQLGTPTSSLAGWIEMLSLKHPEVAITEELARDLARLEKIAERFSKIGSKPALNEEDIISVINQTIDYLKSRTSSKVLIKIYTENIDQLIMPVNAALFSWVIENLCKNAIDAITGEGEIIIKVQETELSAIIDIDDNGTGIPKSAHKRIFKPGYTTKKTGWGLGLSLSKRIIEEYHGGKIFVRHSEIGKGTGIRIVLKKLIN